MWCLFAALFSCFAKGADTSGDDFLAAHGRTATAESISTFLESLAPTSESALTQQKRLANLLAQLGDPDFQVRERAFQQIALATEMPTRALKRAAGSSDPEVQWRVKLLLKQAEKRARKNTVEGVIETVARIVANREITGTTKAMFATFEFVDDQRTIAALSEAIMTTATAADLSQAEHALTSAQPHVRDLGVKLYVSISKSDAVPKLEEIAREDASSQVQLAAATELANLGERTALPELIRLLEVKELSLRVKAVRVLRALTRQKFKYIAYSSEQDRIAAIERWREWKDGPGNKAELTFPLKLGYGFVGKILIGDYGNNKVIEVDIDGNELWSAPLKHAWDCQGLPNGHRLASSYSERRIIEFNADGNKIWEQKNIPGNAMGFDRLQNGNTLVACSSANRVIEYSRENEIVWEASIQGRPVDVQRLENGNTLVALESSKDGNKVVEVNADGDEVWQHKNNSPLTAERLENGNTLIASSGGKNVVEVTPDGEVVWEHAAGQKCTVARRLPNGDTLVGTLARLSAIRADGTVRWKMDGLKYCYGAMPY